MKLELLTKALRHYALSADCTSDDRELVFDAIDECSAQAERYDSRDLWRDTVYLVSADSLDNLLNMATYDIYGVVAKRLKGQTEFHHYEHAVRQYGLDDMTKSALMLGYDIISDLWRENEANGDHNVDGTFKRTNENDAVNCLRRAFEFVDAYRLTNIGHLDADVEKRLYELIGDMRRHLDYLT